MSSQVLFYGVYFVTAKKFGFGSGIGGPRSPTCETKVVSSKLQIRMAESCLTARRLPFFRTAADVTSMDICWQEFDAATATMLTRVTQIPDGEREAVTGLGIKECL